MVKTFPMNREMLEDHSVRDFFNTVVPTVQRSASRLGAFYVIGRHYISREAPTGTLVLFQLEGRIVACARLQENWYDDTDATIAQHEAIAINFIEDCMVLDPPASLTDLPGAWQASWRRGHFDQYPRTLDEDGACEAEFLQQARRS